MNSKYLFAALLGVVIIAGGFSAYMILKNPSSLPTDTEDKTASLPDTTPGYTITQLDIPDDESALPNLAREVVFQANIPEEVRVSLTVKIRETQEKLKADNTDAESWFGLALLYHTANDYEGAKEVWEFLVVAAPKDTVAYDNLGKLYHFSLRDFPKAEEYLLKSISINPKSTVPYVELFTLYRYSYKTNTTSAVDIINKAILEFPDDAGFYVLLGDYHRDRKETAKARAAYTSAMDLAREQNNIQLMNAIGDELAKLPQ